jgi:hypothetical protein
MITARFDLNPVRVFELLVRLSQNYSVPVADIAAEVVARGSGRRR